MAYKCIHRSKIDAYNWAKCVSRSSTQSIYNQIWYLDIVCGKNWKALVWGDYRAVFPLPISGKFGMNFLQNPNLVQQLDIIGHATEADIIELKTFIQLHYKYIALSTRQPIFSKNIERINLMLNVEDYLKAKPSSSLRSNLKKAKDNHLVLKNDNSFVDGLNFLKKYFHLTGMSPSDSEWMFYEDIMKKVHKAGKARFSYSFKGTEIVQFAFWIVDNDIAYYLLNISNEEGRKCGASHFSIHTFISQNQNLKLVDFEGSSIEGVKRFYKSFGAIEEPYYLYRENKLPFFLKWFKK